MFATPIPPFQGGRITLPLRVLTQLASSVSPIRHDQSHGAGQGEKTTQSFPGARFEPRQIVHKMHRPCRANSGVYMPEPLAERRCISQQVPPLS
jgi:hypothetical protein